MRRPPLVVPADAIPVAVANSRLTAILGPTLLILFALQVVTVLAGVRSVLTWHVVLGLILLPPVGLKLTSVTWRMVSYHRGRDGFADITPPPPALRVLGLFLAGLTVTLLVSDITLLDGPGWAQSPALLVHQVSFYAWLAAVVVHIVPHFLQAVHLASRDWARRVGGARRAAGRRGAVLAASLAAGALLAAGASDYLQHVPLSRSSTPGTGMTSTRSERPWLMLLHSCRVKHGNRSPLTARPADHDAPQGTRSGSTPRRRYPLAKAGDVSLVDIFDRCSEQSRSSCSGSASHLPRPSTWGQVPTAGASSYSPSPDASPGCGRAAR